MSIPQVRTAAEGMDATGNVKCLAGRVFNAENLTITDEGRIFVTGSEAVYELATNGTLNNIPIENLPQDCMRNGITTDDNFLYLACTRVHSGDTSLVPRSWCDISKLEQTPLSFFRIIFAEKVICQVDSYIVRASLEEKISFDHVVTRKVGRFFANGLTIDASRILYVANSFPALLPVSTEFLVGPIRQPLSNFGISAPAACRTA